MKRNAIYKILFLTVIALLPMGPIAGQTTDKFSDIRTKFYNPPALYRTAPFMVWNWKVTKGEIDWMLTEFKESGAGSAIIHPRPGLVTEYLSKDWFELYRYAVQKAKSLGMTVWIYDENSYPSCFAGGNVPALMPESYKQGMGLDLHKYSVLPDTVQNYYLCLNKVGDKFIDITSDVPSYKGKSGEFYVYGKRFYGTGPWFGGYSQVDILVKGVTQKFIDVTMKGYESSVGSEFDKTVLGVFSDEPSIRNPMGSLRWAPDLFEVFQKQWGYDLKTVLPLLSEKTGDWKRVRHNYQETLLSMFIDRWSKPYSRYCLDHNLKWTGHYWEHDWPRMGYSPDNMAMYAWHQMPGVDMLFNQFDENDPQAQFGNVRSIKELRSAANQIGQERTLSETYGGGGWSEGFKDFKRLGDWEYALGVNFMNQHLAHMTLTGARKYDYPPVFTYNSPWWQDYKALNDHFGRLSMMMSKGVQKNRILIIEPNSTLWCYDSSIANPSDVMEIGKAFQSFITTLEKSQVEYDLGSENIMKDHGSVSGKLLAVGKASYSTVVLPPRMENLNRPTFDLLSRFIAQGGKVICFSTPDRLEGSESKEVSRLFDSPSVIRLSQLSADVIARHFASPECRIQFRNGDLYHQRRMMADGQQLLLVNSSLDETTSGSVSLKGKSLLMLDTQDGKIYAYPATEKNGMLTAKFEITPAGSLLLYASAAKQIANFPAASLYHKEGQKVAASSQTVVRRLRDNAMILDFCDLTVKGSTYMKCHTMKAAKLAYQAHGFEKGDPWNRSVQFKRQFLDRDTFKTGGFRVVYHFKINGTFDCSGMKAVVEQPQLFTVKVNGTPVTAAPGEWWLDHSFGVYHIGKLVREGSNTIEVSVSPMSIYAEIEPVYITGNFSAVPEAEGFSISAPASSFTLGSWKSQQQPFYSWGFSYSKSYTLGEVKGRYAVKLNRWNGTVAEVFVNGKKAGIVYAKPYSLDISRFLQKGKNSVDVHVIGSLDNLLGAFYDHRNGLISPYLWDAVQKPLAGKDYPLNDYGLMEDFDLLHE